MKLKKLLFILMCALFATNFYATNYYVKTGGSNANDGLTEETAFLTINFAVGAASDGDKIIIVGTVAQVGQTFLNKSLTFEGQSNAVIEGDGANRLFNVQNFANETYSFSNITFKGIVSTLQGAVLNSSTGAAGLNYSFVNCNFLNNTTSGANGGGVFYFASNAIINITGCTFYNNAVVTTVSASARGGAITIFTSATLNIANSTFFGNKVAKNDNNGDGAAIRVNTAGNVVNITNSLFYDNKNNNGTGISTDVAAFTDTTLNITNSLAQFVLEADNSTGSTITNSDFLASSNLTWDEALNKITFTAPSSITDATPIDFGSDFSDVGAWDSEINLFKGLSSDWADGTNWSSTAFPTPLENVVILNDLTNYPVVNSAVTVNSVTLASGASLIANDVFNGSVTYKRNLPTVDSWYLVSSPVSGETIEDLIANHTFLESTNNPGNLAISTFNNSGAPYTYLTAAATGNVLDGKGYSVRLASPGDISFTGTANTSDVTFPLTQGTNNYNLVGNPFTSFINSTTFLTNEAANVELTFWMWNGTSYDTRTTGTSPNFKIAPGQAFFVEAKTTNNVTFTEALQSHEATDTFQKATNTRPEVKLLVYEGSQSRKLEVFYIDGTTKGFDNGFDGKMFGGITDSFSLYSELLSENVGVKYAIQSLPIAEMETMVIPVGIKAAAGKEITFTAEALNLPGDTKVFLEDRLTNTITRLDEANASYKVTLNDALNGTGRFYLHTKSSSVLSTDDTILESISIYTPNKSTLRVVGLSQGKATVKVFNILGKQMMESSFTTTNSQDISLPRLATGMYIVQLETATGKLNKKIVLE